MNPHQPSATHPRFDKLAFSRFSQLFQPRLVVHSFGKIVKRQVFKNGGELPTAEPHTKILENEIASRACVCSMDVAMVCRRNQVLSLAKYLEMRRPTSGFVSKIVVWEATSWQRSLVFRRVPFLPMCWTICQSPHWGEQFDKRVNHRCRVKDLSKCSPQWGRLSNTWGGTAHETVLD